MTYEELRESRKNKLMSRYNEFIQNKDKVKAWKVLADLMRFKLVDMKWAENEVKKTFAKSERGEILRGDVRAPGYNDRLPDNLVCTMPEVVKEVNVTSLAHWIIRRELQYVGDQFAPDKVVKYTLGRSAVYQVANKALKDLEDIYNRNSTRKLNTNWKESIQNGQAMIYGVNLANGQQYIIPVLGNIVVIPKNKEEAKVYVMLDVRSMVEQNIDVIDTYNAVMDAIKEILDEAGIVNMTVQDMIDYKASGNKQRSERKAPMSQSEMLEMREQEFDREKAKDIAFRTHRDEEEVYQEVRAERAKAKAEAQ